MNQYSRSVEFLNFKDIDALLFSESQRRNFIGPPAPPITDYRICAGLLFERRNDNTHRCVSFHPGEEVCTITVRTDIGACDATYKFFLVERELVEMLYQDSILCGTVRVIDTGIVYTDTTELRLSELGKQAVTQKWFL